VTQLEWQHLSKIFSGALELSPADRESYLRDKCGEDRELLEHLGRLLAEHENATGFLDNPGPTYNALMSTRTILGHRFSTDDILCSRFRVVEFIARGGMGEVYEAVDMELRESVALKTIRREIAADTEVVEQFKREVRRARTIPSPHVCRVYDLFSDQTSPGEKVVFLTMKLLRGETLADRLKRGRLTTDESLPIAMDMVDGLAAAHRENIVHGDFKCGNVILAAEEGGTSAVITDFGLAHRAIKGKVDGETTTEFVPKGGTPAYMAPEQVLGEQPTTASDIYALGVVLYQMTTGHLPFEGGTEEQCARKRLKELPPRPRDHVPGFPSQWETTILRCLERDPAYRFTRAEDVALSLAGVSVAGARSGSRRIWLGGLLVACVILLALALWLSRTRGKQAASGNTVAVLPFHNDAHPGGDYFSDAFSEDLALSLTRMPTFRVVGRETAFSFRDTTLPPQEIGKRIGVRYLLTGTLSRDAGHLRVMAGLVSTDNGFRVWAQDYRRQETEVDEIRDRICREIAQSLNIQVAGMQSGSPPPPPLDLQARDLYWMGRFYWRKRTEEDVAASLQYFQKAIARDPEYALAYSGLADAYCVLAENATLQPPAHSLASAKQAALTAIALDANLPDAHVSLGQVCSVYDRDFVAAERHFRKAIELNPHLVSAHQWYSYMLAKQRRFRESLQEARLAVSEDALSGPANINLALQLFYAEVDDEAIQQCRKLAQMQPELISPHLVIAQIFARKGLASEASREIELVRKDKLDDILTLRTQAEVYARAGSYAASERALEALIAKRGSRQVPSSYIAAGYAAQGKSDLAFAWLEKAYAEHDGFVSLVNVYPAFASLRSDPRFDNLLARLGLSGK
jgi:eukaryotic-like serine/threonine-protein kinase